MSTAKRRIVSLVLAVCLLLAMPGPVAAQAVRIASGGPFNVTVGDGGDNGPPASSVTMLGFGGEEWYVIGYDNDGVYSDPGTMTLLATSNIGTDTTYGSNSNYSGSNLQNRLDGIYQAMDSRERDIIEARSLTDTYDAPVNDQPLWPLNVDEAKKVSYSVRGTSTYWWLRSPGVIDPDFDVAFVGSGSVFDLGVAGSGQRGARPAFQLNLESVIFTSSAVGGKSAATEGSGLVSATAPTQNLKLTVKDSTMHLNGVNTTAITAKQGETFHIAYTSANFSGSDHYISCVLEQGGVVKYYGKLAAANSGGGNAPVKLLTDIPTGSYDLRVFVEQANDYLHTDFASEPINISLKVEAPDAALVTVAGQPISVTGGDGSAATPFVAAIGLGHSVDSVADTDLVVSDGATAKLYADGTYAMPGSPVDLDEGANDLYIKVESQGGIVERHYHVTATRATLGQYSVTLTADPLQGGIPTATPNPATATQLVTLTANPASGYTFDRWESASPGVVIASPTQLTTTFEMPHNDVAVVAHYTQDDGDGDIGGNNGNNSGGSVGAATTSGGSSRSDDSGGASYTTPVKAQIPDSAFSWDGDRTLTIAYDGITALGLTGVKWDGAETTAYTVHQGSVIVRFDQDFIGAQSGGEHRVRVEFLNHYGETAVSVGEGATGTDDGTYDDAFVDGSYNPNTGDGSCLLILLALLGCFGGLALAVWARGKRV